MAVTNLTAGNATTIAPMLTQNGHVHVYFVTSGITGSITYTLGNGTGRNAPRSVTIPINNGGPHQIALNGQPFNILNLSNKTIQILH